MTSGTVLSSDKFPYRWNNSIQYYRLGYEVFLYTVLQVRVGRIPSWVLKSHLGLKTLRRVCQPLVGTCLDYHQVEYIGVQHYHEETYPWFRES